jgi:hypothetical protein
MSTTSPGFAPATARVDNWYPVPRALSTATAVSSLRVDAGSVAASELRSNSRWPVAASTTEALTCPPRALSDSSGASLVARPSAVGAGAASPAAASTGGAGAAGMPACQV